MRALRIVGLIVGVLVALPVLGTVAVLLWVDPNDYRTEIEQRVAAGTGRPLHLGGKLRLKIFPRIALEANDVSLGNPAGYGTEPFLTVKQARVGMRLWPLLHKRLEVSRIALDGLAVNLVSRGDADNNWKDLGKSDESKPAGSGAETRTSVAGLDLTGATLNYRDEAAKKTTRLSDFNLHTGALSSGAPVDWYVEFDYGDGGPRPLAHLVTEAIVRLPQDASRAELKDLVLKGKWLGSPHREFSARAPALVLDWKAETLAPATFDVRFGDLPLTITATGEKLFSERAIAGNVNVNRVSLRKLLPSLGVSVPHTRDPTVLNAFAFKSDYRLTEEAMQLKSLDLTLDDTHIRGSAGIDNLDRMALSFDLGVDTIDVDRYREPEDKTAKASAPAAPPVDLPRDALRKLNARGTLRVGHATLADLKFDEIRLPFDAAGGLVHLGPTQARLFGGSYNGDIVLDVKPAKAHLTLNEHARDFDVGQLVNAAFDTTRMVGRGDANAALTAAGNTDAAMLASLRGKIDANLKDGAFNGVDLWFELRRALALVKGQAPPQRSEPVRTVFRTFAGSATLTDGVLRNDDLRFDMDYVKARGQGTLALATQAVDYHLTAEVYKLPAAGAGSEMSDLKALEVPVAVTGTLADLKVRPDVAGLAKARLRKEVDKQVDKQKEQLKKKLGEKLQDLLGR